MRKKQVLLREQKSFLVNFRPSKCVSAVGVVVSCKIPILATRVRFPDGADSILFSLNVHLINEYCPLLKFSLNNNKKIEILMMVRESYRNGN
jgi:hypothetical protein